VSRLFTTRVTAPVKNIHQSLLEIIVVIVQAECRPEEGEGHAVVRRRTGRRTGWRL